MTVPSRSPTAPTSWSVTVTFGLLALLGGVALLVGVALLGGVALLVACRRPGPYDARPAASAAGR